MVTPVKTKAKIVTDITGVASELPVLVTEQGVLEPLLDYLLSHQHDRSPVDQKNNATVINCQ